MWIIKKIKELYLEYKMWHNKREFDKEVDSNIAFWMEPRTSLDTQYVQDSVAQKYQEGLLKLKKTVHSLMQVQSKEEYDKTLKQMENLILFAKNEPGFDSEYLDKLKDLIVAKGCDIETEEDKKAMIQQRIGHFYSLQNHKLKREMSRRIRQLEREGKTQEAIQLTKVWREKYGNERYNK